MKQCPFIIESGKKPWELAVETLSVNNHWSSLGPQVHWRRQMVDHCNAMLHHLFDQFTVMVVVLSAYKTELSISKAIHQPRQAFMQQDAVKAVFQKDLSKVGRLPLDGLHRTTFRQGLEPSGIVAGRYLIASTSYGTHEHLLGSALSFFRSL